MFKKLSIYIGEYKKESILSPIFIACEIFLEMLIPTIMGLIVDKGLAKNDMKYVAIMGVLTLILAMVCMLFGIGAGKAAAKASAGFAKNIRNALFSKIQKFSFTNIDRFSTAGLITRFTTDINNIQTSYQMILRILLRAPFMMIFAIIMTMRINLKLSMIFVYAIILLGSALTCLIIVVNPIFRKAIQFYDVININLQENISAIRVVKSFVKENTEIQKFKESTNKLKEMMLKGETLTALVSPGMQLSMFSCTILLSWFGSKLILSNELTTGELMSFFTYSSNILIGLLMLALTIVTISWSKASAERILEVLEEEGTIKNPENPIFEIENGNIEFKNVNYSYLNNPNILHLENINLKIKSGETLGIIGGTGSSKSALVQLIPRLYDVISGEVIVGAKNVKEYDLKVLRDNVAMVLQKNILFTGTIKENLRWGNKEATDEEIVNACKLAQADEFIQKFPEKYDTLIERGGTNVSGG